MSENQYRSAVERIPVPEGLNERVLLAARQRKQAEKRLRVRQVRPMLRAAVCAACALALVLGTVRFRTASLEEPVRSGGTAETGGRDLDSAAPLALSFGLTACAAGSGRVYPAREDGAAAFAAGEGMADPAWGSFTGCLFQIAGEGVKTVELSIDRGGLYRYRVLENLTDEDMERLRQAMAEGEIPPAAVSMRDDGVWYMPEMTVLGGSIREDYDPGVWYGFWVSPEDMACGTGMDMDAEFRADADVFDGASLTAAVTFADGSKRTQVYRLRTGDLRAEWTEDYVLTVLPELAGENEPCVYGICAVPEQ